MPATAPSRKTAASSHPAPSRKSAPGRNPAPVPKTDLGECPCHGTTLERFIRPAVLMVLARGDENGYRIVQQLAELPIFGGRRPNAAGVYRCLKAMEDEGSVTSSWEASDRGPDKQLYTLTAEGERCLAAWLVTLHDYQQAIGELWALGKGILKKRTAASGKGPDSPCCAPGCAGASGKSRRTMRTKVA